MRTWSGEGSAAHWHVRLFRNLPQVRWRYRVHEQIVNAVREAGHALRRTEIVIRHEGYADPQVLKRKLERNLRLLRRAIDEHPGDPFLVMNLGSTQLALGRPAEACDAFGRYLGAAADVGRRARAFLLRVRDGRAAARRPAAGDRAVSDGAGTACGDAELLLLDSVLQHQAGQFAAAADSLRNLLKKGQKPLLGEIDVARYRKACGNLIALLRKLGRTTEADEWLVRGAGGSGVPAGGNCRGGSVAEGGAVR